MAGAGYYGKLPSQGDFVSRNLPREFVAPWDSWLQNVLSCSQEQLAADWLDIYLTSPVWHFSLSPGVVGDQMWGGVMLPSVDRVGRYFPFTIAAPITADCAPVQLHDAAAGWFDGLEAIALEALDTEFDLSGLAARLEDHGAALHESMIACRVPAPLGSRRLMMRAGMDKETDLRPGLTACIARLLNEIVPAHSVWWSRGSQRVAPSLIFAAGIVPVTGFAAMLDGNWARWGWSDDGAGTDGGPDPRWLVGVGT